MMIDTNIIIYAVHPDRAGLRDWLCQQMPCCSVITRVETLGYHRLTDEDRQSLEAIFEFMPILYPSRVTFELAITLRQKRKIALGDALVAATALEHRQTLATANIVDFQWITGLSLVNPTSGADKMK
ncbi:MAG: type II toxin-antitoxin system VapC family toxin [Magnetococcales bacterium]|nr:type II toxin-antitoxin system VapC family toxin [Magnetococcales bacterium]NGZ07056.1 type II toxin-antitoxin system VapC family toxin [Magnetococcales bacterium]